MKKHIAWIVLVAVGVLLIAGNLLYPLAAMAIAAESEPLEGSIAIIGGADAPTDIVLYRLALGNGNVALIALGVLSLFAGIILCVSTVRNRGE